MIPLKNSNTILTQHWPQYIVIHDTAERVKHTNMKLDKPDFQTGKMQNYIFQMTREPETKYHIIIERSGNDFYPIMSQPLFTLSKWNDLDPKYYSAIHIAFFGDYSEDFPITRAYVIAAYKVICPLMRMFRLNDDRIVLHKQISQNTQCTCPGEFFDFTRLKMYIKTYRRFRPISKS